MAKSYILPIVFGQKEGQMLSDLYFETRLGILSSFHSFLTPICKDLYILIFWPNIVGYFQNFNRIGADQNEDFWENKLYALIS